MFYGSRRSHPNPLFIGPPVCASSYYLSMFSYEAPAVAESLLLRKVLHLFPRHPTHGPYSASWVRLLQQTIFPQKCPGPGPLELQNIHVEFSSSLLGYHKGGLAVFRSSVRTRLGKESSVSIPVGIPVDGASSLSLVSG